MDDLHGGPAAVPVAPDVRRRALTLVERAAAFPFSGVMQTTKASTYRVTLSMFFTLTGAAQAEPIPRKAKG
ncbi:hypothetical protein SCOCK_120103 [Actinacidiphila cocklensis]|uniref:Uncharacterized protein n=1 Tax=Actinacidiphila cocklensis TaxID=887465 RepID=A0A9W4GNP4_9ACTN|nr:hypothetical protein SCOCK_120103 [Actinacidiphila cocklensis]